MKHITKKLTRHSKVKNSHINNYLAEYIVKNLRYFSIEINNKFIRIHYYYSYYCISIRQLQLIFDQLHFASADAILLSLNSVNSQCL